MDFKVAWHDVTVMMDARLSNFSPPLIADHVVQISEAGSAPQTLGKVAETMDAVLIVAPEADKNLQKLIERVESTDARSLNSKPADIAQAADKASFPARLKGLGLKSPKTITFSLKDLASDITQAVKDELGFPAIFKPSNGAGCSGMSIVQGEADVVRAVDKIRREPLW